MAGIIAFNNYLRAATVVSQTTISGFPFANSVDGRTSTTVGFASGATRTAVLQFTAPLGITAVGFARSNLSAMGGTITFSGSSDNVSYTTIATITPSTDIVTLQTLSAVFWQYVRISISGHTGSVYLSDIYCGSHVDLPCNVDTGFSPPEYCDNDEVLSNLTYTNELAGLIVQRKLKNAMFKFDAIEPSWMVAQWAALTAALKQYPIYWVWKTGARAFYCWPEKTIGAPKYAQGGKYFSVSFKVEGITE